MTAPKKNYPTLPKVLKVLLHSAFFIIFSILAYNCSVTSTLAGSGLLTQVGGATFVQGASQFYVTSARPTFLGITTANTQVTGSVGSQSLSATADASGNWSWTPTADLVGDNTVSISSDSQNVSFTLTIGALPEAIASQSAGTLAPAGILMPTMAVLGFGLVLTTFGLWGLKRGFAKS